MALLKAKQVAERLGVSLNSVYQLAAHGILIHHRIGIGRGTLRFKAADVEAYFDSCRVDRPVKSAAMPPPPRRASGGQPTLKILSMPPPSCGRGKAPPRKKREASKATIANAPKSFSDVLMAPATRSRHAALDLG